METGDGTSNSANAEYAELNRCLSSRAVNNRVAIADGGGVTHDKEVCHLKNEDVNNRMAMADGFAIFEGRFGRGECLQTYKRRKHSKMICPERKVQEEGRKCVKDFCNQALDFHTKPQQTGECVTNKFCTCRHCGGKADATDCLICDSCEEVYHVSCIGIEPDVKEIQDKSWFCANCTDIGTGSLHDNCVVCARLYVPKSLNNNGDEERKPTNDETLNELEENSNCTSDGIRVSIGWRNSPDCKICGEGVNGEQIKKCGHPLCPNKYYHVRCLSIKQLKLHGACWYCPSCLCGVCLKDKDDHKIVLCDGCNDAYHIYCMEPRRTSIPRGKWFCRKCDAGIRAIHLAKKVYANNKRRAGDNVSISNDKLDKRWKQGEELDKDGGTNMLLTASNSINYEENLAAGHIESRRK